MNVLFSIILFFKTIVANIPTQLIVTRVGPCLDQKSSEMVTVSEMSLHKEGAATSLSGPFQILKDIENGWTVKATMQKCHDIRNLDTCDFYKAAAIIRDGCVEEEDQTLFHDFAKRFSPRLSCPIKAGNYTLKRFPYDASSILINAKCKISTSVFGYTYRLEGFNYEVNRIFCIDSKLRMIYVRKHNWIGSQKLEREETSTEITTKTIEKENEGENGNEDTENGKTNSFKDNINNKDHIDDKGDKTGDNDETEAETEKGDTETEKDETETKKDETESEKESEKDDTGTETGTSQVIPTSFVSPTDPESDNEEVGVQTIKSNMDIHPTENEDDE